MKINTLKYSSKRKGFILFVVLGILSILGLLFYSIHQRSGQRNLEAHKHHFNESSRTLSQSGIELFNGAFREGIKTPSDFNLKSILNRSNSYKDSFYGLLLLDIPKLKILLTPDKKHLDNEYKSLEHDQIFSRFSDSYKKMYSNLLSYYPKSTLTFRLLLKIQPLYGGVLKIDSFESSSTLKDFVEKRIDLEFCADATYRFTKKTTCVNKSLKIYNLYNPVLSKFTFFHKIPISDKYNSFVTNVSGRPESPIKFAPLILTNGPFGNDEVPDDQMILGALGDNKKASSLDGLTRQGSIKKSRDSIYRRGYLFFGMGPENQIPMTSGFTRSSELGSKNYSAGQFFHLYNPAIKDPDEDNDGGAESPHIIPFNKPDFFSNPLPIISKHLQDPKERDIDAQPLLYNTYLGYHKPSDIDYQQYVPAFEKYSSLIHPFGADYYPSRAKTIGPATFNVIKIARYFLDEQSGDADEDNLRPCTTAQIKKIKRRDANIGIIPNSNPSRYKTHMRIENPEANYRTLTDCDPPQSFVLNEQWTIPFIFPEFQQYAEVMSKEVKIPMNETLDYPHFSHAVIPPTGHANFEGYMLPNTYDGLKAEDIDENDTNSYLSLTEIWPLAKSNIRSENSYYVNGLVSDFTNSNFISSAINTHSFYRPYSSLKQLKEDGILISNGSKYFLDGKGVQITYQGDLLLDQDIIVQGHTNITVSGNCFLAPISSQFYTAFNCQNIILLPSKRLGKDVHVYDAFLNAEFKISKADPFKGIYIFGGIAMSDIDRSIFLNSSHVQYNINYSPFEDQRDYFYRMVLDDHVKNGRTL
ncbi:MAG: hypothetical protein COB02_10095 [Candidatus Cloacimonadota bacterium]|nr:MAG: hypothetical protein COB02_10095 [Candidatus Cloacimonadota bacterium]